jgi:hypothetical protein
MMTRLSPDDRRQAILDATLDDRPYERLPFAVESS